MASLPHRLPVLPLQFPVQGGRGLLSQHTHPHTARTTLPRCYAPPPPQPPYTLPLILFTPSLPQSPPSAHLHRSISPPHTLPSNTIHTLTTPLIITTSPPSPQPSLPAVSTLRDNHSHRCPLLPQLPHPPPINLYTWQPRWALPQIVPACLRSSIENCYCYAGLKGYCHRYAYYRARSAE